MIKLKQKTFPLLPNNNEIRKLKRTKVKRLEHFVDRRTFLKYKLNSKQNKHFMTCPLLPCNTESRKLLTTKVK